MLGNKEAATRQYVSVRRGVADEVDDADMVFTTRLRGMVRNALDARKQGGRNETVRFGTARSGRRG